MENFNYYRYLLELVNIDKREQLEYSMLFKTLFKTEFFWSVPMDENRALDGTSLRERFTEDTGEVIKEKGPCNCLEMIVALSIRCDRDIMGEKGCDNPGQWFWDILCNLRLDEYPNTKFNPEKVKSITRKMVFRKYDFSGLGGMFPLKNPKIDQRNVEIWYQLNSWLGENYG